MKTSERCALFALASVLGCSNAGELHPIVAGSASGSTSDSGSEGSTGGTGGVAVAGLFFVEPFEYHYPDEGTYERVDAGVQIKLALGEHEPGSFVFVPLEGVQELVVVPDDLLGPGGTMLPAEMIRVGVVTFMNRSDNAGRTEMVWRSGVERGGSSEDSREFHQDARDRLPLLPGAIVRDATEAESRMAGANPSITLTDGIEARARAVAGQGVQFWVTVHVPADFELPEPVTSFGGALDLYLDDRKILVPMRVEVLRTTLDTLEAHGKHVGVMTALEHNDSAFEDAILADLRDHGANALRAPIATPSGYAPLSDNGIGVVLNLATELEPADLAAVADAGFAPYLFHGLTEPSDAEVVEALDAAVSIHDRGGLYADAMAFDVLETIAAQEPVDYWAHAITTYELDDTRSSADFDAFLAHLDAVRSNPRAKIATMEAHYAEVFAGQAPLQARLLYGFWLYRSNLDGAVASGYAIADDEAVDNPWTSPSYRGVTFPAIMTDAQGVELRREMIPTYTWEAMREGIDDFRYALTAARMIDERGTAGDRETFETLLADYGPLYVDGDRVDYRHREADVRATRYALFDLIA
ncbi:MAG: hypothetical protein AAF721_17110, partial [Myxococcota bacterium]